ncbi:MAG: calcium-binding protein [Pseudomonadota bacterium]
MKVLTITLILSFLFSFTLFAYELDSINLDDSFEFEPAYGQGICNNHQIYMPKYVSCWFGTSGDDVFFVTDDNKVKINNEIVGDYVLTYDYPAGSIVRMHIFLGFSGNDQIAGGPGFDFIVGGPGDDYLFGGDYKDKLEGRQGNDILQAGAGDDVLEGGSGDDILLGEAGNDILRGQTGVDYLDGGLDADILDGGKQECNTIITDDNDLYKVNGCD